MARKWNEKRGRGAKKKAVKVISLGVIPGDLVNSEWRVERRFWEDGTSCFHAVKWGQLENGTWQPWWPLTMIQVPWEDAPRILTAFLGFHADCPSVDVQAMLPLRALRE